MNLYWCFGTLVSHPDNLTASFKNNSKSNKCVCAWRTHTKKMLASIYDALYNAAKLPNETFRAQVFVVEGFLGNLARCCIFWWERNTQSQCTERHRMDRNMYCPWNFGQGQNTFYATTIQCDVLHYAVILTGKRENGTCVAFSTLVVALLSLSSFTYRSIPCGCCCYCYCSMKQQKRETMT